MSQFHVSRLFKQSLGISPYQYLLQQRVEHASTDARRPLLTIAPPTENYVSAVVLQPLPAAERSHRQFGAVVCQGDFLHHQKHDWHWESQLDR